MADVANFIAQHPPAIRVGGRRLSVSTKHKPHPAPDPTPAAAPAPVDEPVVDYPRPAPPAAGEDAPVPPPHHEEEPQRKDRRHEDERKLMVLAQRKAEMTRPTRDAKSGGKAFGGAGRIAQPMKDLRI
ncbi:hypothetical protein B0H10DRAFT_2033319 [Mycena sp. CBHHK59/15]|nr:hypothetical protein B0H10DRAFT_2033319 [Mycena sp. CBHHK59/15]